VKTFLSAAVLAGLLAVVAAAWHLAGRAGQVSASQIVIHGTPVCVIGRDGAVTARVGECAAFGFRGGGAGVEKPLQEETGLRLPPWHPPVPEAERAPGQRRFPI